MRVTNQTTLPSNELAKIQEQLPAHENLQQMMNWALADRTGTFIPEVVSQVIVQDEFSHDVIVPWRDGLTLVYDTT
jgi:hypothetical protein